MKSIVTEAAKRNVKVNDRFLSRRFSNIAHMAPDVLDLAVAAIGHPALGLGAAVKKMADKAKKGDQAGIVSFEGQRITSLLILSNKKSTR